MPDLPDVPRPAPLPDTLQFMQLLWALVHALERTSKHMTRRVGVTGPQRLVLRVVGLMPGVAAGELAAILHLHPSTLTGVLHRLVKQKLVARTRDASDGRKAVLHLTARGAQINAVGQGTVEAAVARALDDLSPHDRAACRRVLDKLTETLDRSADASPRAARRRRPGIKAGPSRGVRGEA